MERTEESDTILLKEYPWLIVSYILSKSIPVIVKILIPESDLGTDDFPDETDDDLRYSQKLSQFLNKEKERLNNLDKDFVTDAEPKNLLKAIDFIRLCRIFKTLFEQKYDKKHRILETLKDIQNLRDQSCITKLKESLIELGVTSEKLEEFDVVMLHRSEYENIIKKYKEFHKPKDFTILPLNTDSPHKSLSDKLTEVFKQWKDHSKYGNHVKCVDDSIYYVDHEDFLICEEKENGCVYLGYQKPRWIALKKISTAGGKVPKEVEVMIKLRSQLDKYKCIVKINGFSDKNSLYYLAMELCDYTLDQYIDKFSFSALERCDLAKQLLEAITFLHCEQKEKPSIVHRDLKPNNVLIKMVGNPEKPELKIADYGMSVQRSNAEETPVAKGVSAWKWYAPGSSDSEDSPVWYENDVFVTNSLLAFILSSNHLHPYKEAKDKERDLMRKYENKQFIGEKLDIHEEFRDFLNENFQNYFKFYYDIKENRRLEELNTENAVVVTEREKVCEKDIKEKLQIDKIKDRFVKLYPVENPNTTKGKRYAILIICNHEKLRDEANSALNDIKPVELQFNNDIHTEAKRKQKAAFGGMEDAAIIRRNLEKCKFNIKPNVLEPNIKKYLDMNESQLMEIIDDIKVELNKEKYSDDVYLFLWILAHGNFDSVKQDTYILMGEYKSAVFVQELLYDIQQKIQAPNDDKSQPNLKTVAIIDCCRDEDNITASYEENTSDSDEENVTTNSSDTLSTIDGAESDEKVPTDVIGLYSVPKGEENDAYHTGTSFPWIFANKVADHIQPGVNIKQMFSNIINEMKEEHEKTKEKYEKMNKEHIKIPEQFSFKTANVEEFNF